MQRRSFLSLSIASPLLIMLGSSALKPMAECTTCGKAAHFGFCFLESEHHAQN